MATCQKKEESQKCPVCLENGRKLRKLPTCKHQFCEACIFNQIVEYKIESELGFICPVCRVDNPCAAGNDKDVHCWISTLEMADEFVVEQINLCSPCEKRGVSTGAVKYCLDCREFLCGQCFELSQTFKGLQDHTVIDISTSDGNPREQLDVNHALIDCLACEKHRDQNVTLVCENDKELCCQKCILINHRTCSKISELSQLGLEELDGDVRELELSMKGLTTDCQSITDNVKENETENKAAAENIGQSVSDMRTKMNQLFDVMEENISQECKALLKKCALSNETIIREVKDNVSKLKFASSLLEAAKATTNKTLIYVVLSRLENRFHEIETRVVEIARGSKKFTFDLHVENRVNDFIDVDINEPEKLAAIKKTECEIVVPSRTETKQNHCNIQKVDTYGILACNSKGDCPTYSGVAFTPENKLVLVDSNYGYGCLVSNTYKLLGSCKFTISNIKKEIRSKKPFGAAYLEGIFVVSSPLEMKLFVVKEENAKLVIHSEVNTPYSAKAVHALKNGDLAVSWTEPCAFGIISLKNGCLHDKLYIDRDKAGRVLKSFDYMAIDQRKSHVIQPCTVDKAVFCFDFQGHPKFEYRYKELEPSGVGVDASGNVYICDANNGCIHIVSATGIPIRIHKEGCPGIPLAFSFNMDKTTFAITHGFKDYYDLRRKEVQIFRLGQ